MDLLRNVTFPDVFRAQLYIQVLLDALQALEEEALSSIARQSAAECGAPGLSLRTTSSTPQQDNSNEPEGGDLPAQTRRSLAPIVLESFVCLLVSECDRAVATAMSPDFAAWKARQRPSVEPALEHHGGSVSEVASDLYELYCSSVLCTLPQRHRCIGSVVEHIVQYHVQSVVGALRRLGQSWRSVWAHRRNLLMIGSLDEHEESAALPFCTIEISRIDVLDADPHPGGAPVAFTLSASPSPNVCRTQSSTTLLVYKPRGEDGLRWFTYFVDRVFAAVSPDAASIKPKLPFVLQCCDGCGLAIRSSLTDSASAKIEGTRCCCCPSMDSRSRCYAWESFIPSRTSQQQQQDAELEASGVDGGDADFQRRCGSLLACAACARLTDGHMHNVIRTPDGYPVLVDGETVLTPQPGGIPPHDCTASDLVLLTGLLQDLNQPAAEVHQDDGCRRGKILNGATSAFQTRYVSTVFRPVIMHDGTNKFSVEFLDVVVTGGGDRGRRGSGLSVDRSTPHFAFLEEIGAPFLDGFACALKYIAAASVVDASHEVWRYARDVNHRLVLRPTVHYKLVLYKLLSCSEGGTVHADVSEPLSVLQRWRSLLPSTLQTRIGSDAQSAAELIERLEAKALVVGHVPVWALKGSTADRSVVLHVMVPGDESSCDHKHLKVSTLRYRQEEVLRFATAASGTHHHHASSGWCGIEAAIAGTITLTSNVANAVHSVRQIVRRRASLNDRHDLFPSDARDTSAVVEYLKKSVDRHWLPLFTSPPCPEAPPLKIRWEHTSLYSGSIGVACALALGGEWECATKLLMPILDACDALPACGDAQNAFRKWMSESVGITGVGGLLYGLSIVLLRCAAIASANTPEDSGVPEEDSHLPAHLLSAIAAAVSAVELAVRPQSGGLFGNDVITGAAGLLLGLCATRDVLRYLQHSAFVSPGHNAGPQQCTLVESLDDLVVTAIQRVSGVVLLRQARDGSFARADGKPPYSGFSHGQSGIAFALARVLQVLFTPLHLPMCNGHSALPCTPRPLGVGADFLNELQSAITRAIAYEDSEALFAYTPCGGHWLDMRSAEQHGDVAPTVHLDVKPPPAMSWCHGAPGILLARLYIRRVLVAVVESCLLAEGMVDVPQATTNAEAAAWSTWLATVALRRTSPPPSFADPRPCDLCCGPASEELIYRMLSRHSSCRSQLSETRESDDTAAFLPSWWKSTPSRLAPSRFGFHPSCLFKGISGVWVAVSRAETSTGDDRDARILWPDILLLLPF